MIYENCAQQRRQKVDGNIITDYKCRHDVKQIWWKEDNYMVLKL